MVNPALVAQALNFTDTLLENSLLDAIYLYYYNVMGPVFPGMIILAVTLCVYVWTQSIDFVIGLWFLIGLALEAALPGPALSIGKILMILGLTGFFVRLWIGEG